jgi:flavin reductase (DIM6/NTAB) family NADH-FMN oxidoreductase RutF
MARRLFDPADARRLLNPGPVSIVTASWRGTANATPIAWTASLSMEPPLVGVTIHPSRHIADMIRFAGAFSLNIPGPALLKHVAFLGSLSGRDADKIEAAGFETFTGLRNDAPLIEGCLAWLECDLQEVAPHGDHLLFVGQVYKVHALEEAYSSFWLLEERDLSPLTYLGGDRYAVIGEPLRAEYQVDEHGALVVETVEEREQREEDEAAEQEREKLEGEEGIQEIEQAAREAQRDDGMRRRFF